MSNAVCHYCHKQSADPVESEWDLIFQCWVCDDCLARVKREYPKGGWLYVVKGGEYADGRPDPRATKQEATR